MDEAAKGNAIGAGTRIDLLSNRLDARRPEDSALQ